MILNTHKKKKNQRLNSKDLNFKHKMLTNILAISCVGEVFRRNEIEEVTPLEPFQGEIFGTKGYDGGEGQDERGSAEARVVEMSQES